MARENIEVSGVVIREVKIGEADKILTVLTAELGKLTVNGKGTSSLRSQHASSVQIFAYSTFTLTKKGDFYYIKDSYLNESFMNLRYDLDKLSLANYICDVAHDIATEGVEHRELLQLLLNTLYALANRDIPEEQIKAAYEFRLAAQEGFMPDLDGCGVCGAHSDGDSFLDVMNGRLLCKKCRELLTNDPEYMADEVAKIMIRVTPGVLAALSYIATANTKKYLSFTLEKDDLELLSVVAERYLLNHIEHGFSSLEFYKTIKGDLPH